MIPIPHAIYNPFVTRSNRFAPTFCPPNVAMVEPNASIMAQKKHAILEPDVREATAALPKPLTAVCKITLPIAVMEYCNPIGSPI